MESKLKGGQLGTGNGECNRSSEDGLPDVNSSSTAALTDFRAFTRRNWQPGVKDAWRPKRIQERLFYAKAKSKQNKPHAKVAKAAKARQTPIPIPTA
jgi:hypothetical protein